MEQPEHEYLHGESDAFMCHVNERATEITPDRFEFCPFCGDTLTEDRVLHTEVNDDS